MAEKQKKEKFNLRTVEGMNYAHEWLFNQQVAGKVDNKSADAMNTTLKGSMYLNGKLKLDAAKLFYNAAVKKIELPVADIFSEILPGFGKLKIEGE